MNLIALIRSVNPLDLRGSWKTTLCGIVAIIAIAAAEFELFPPEYQKHVNFVGVVALGVGLMLARDVDKRSEDHNLPSSPTP